ncbi:MAG: hypothetical protein ACI30H_09245 [Paludibacteraceae bacterium]
MILTKRLLIALFGLFLCGGIECVAEDIFSMPLMTTIERNYPSTQAVRSGTSVRAAVPSAPAACGTSYSILPSTNTLFNNKQRTAANYAVGGSFGGGTSTGFSSCRTASASVADNAFANELFGETTVRPFAVPQTRGIPGTGTGVLCPLPDAVGFLLCLALGYLLLRRKRVQRQSLSNT